MVSTRAKRVRGGQVAGATTAAVFASSAFLIGACTTSAERMAPVPAHALRAVLTANFRLPDGILAIVTGGGTVWAATGSSVLRIDPRTDRSKEFLSMPGASLNALAYGAGSLWVGDGTGVLRVDPVTAKVTSRVGVPAFGLSFGDGALWTRGRTTLVGIDPRTMTTRTIALPFGKIGGFAPGEGAVWVSSTGGCPSKGGCVLRVDPSSGHITARISGVPALAIVATGGGAVWASDGTSVVRIDPKTDRVAQRIELPPPLVGSGDPRSLYGSGLLAVAPGFVWVTATVNGRNTYLERIDVGSGRLVANRVPVADDPNAMAATGRTVWVATGHDRLTRVDLVACGPARCVPPAPPAPPSSLTNPVVFQSLQMVSSSIGWSIASPQNAGPPGSPTLFPARTTNGGRSWRDVTPLVGNKRIGGSPSALFAAGADRAWLAVTGTNGQVTTVFFTDDGGKRWAPAGSLRTEGAASFLDFVDQAHGWLLVDLGAAMGADAVAIFRTTDRGRHWALVARSPSLVSPGTGGGLGGLPLYCGKTGMVFATPRTGWVSLVCNAGGEELLVTHDGGLTWASQDLPIPSDACTAMCNVSLPELFGSTGFAAVQWSREPTLLVTHDAGATWSAVKLPAGAGRDPVAQFVDARDGFLVPRNPQRTSWKLLYVTRDGAKSWQLVHPNVALPENTVQFVSPSSGFVWGATGAGSPPLYSTPDGGGKWVYFIPRLAS